MVDKLLVQQRLALILQYMEKLKNYRAVPREFFLGGHHNYRRRGKLSATEPGGNL